MKKYLSGLCATMLAISFTAASVAPINAAPVFVPTAPTVSSDVVLAQYQKRRIMRRDFRRDFRRGDRYAWYRGHRGYRYRRPGYRYYNGYWFPAAAFIAGAIIGGAIANQPVYGGNAHVRWCYSRYRSYRAYDNTYQPYSGPRRQCYSPY